MCRLVSYRRNHQPFYISNKNILTVKTQELLNKIFFIFRDLIGWTPFCPNAKIACTEVGWTLPGRQMFDSKPLFSPCKYSNNTRRIKPLILMYACELIATQKIGPTNILAHWKKNPAAYKTLIKTQPCSKEKNKTWEKKHDYCLLQALNRLTHEFLGRLVITTGVISFHGSWKVVSLSRIKTFYYNSPPPQLELFFHFFGIRVKRS